MSDTDKVKLIEHVAADALEFGGSESGWLNGVLSAIASICDYEEIEDE